MTFIISELSNQWGGSLATLNSMILQSSLGGADAAKIQLFGDDWNPKRKNSEGHDYLSLTNEMFKYFCKKCRDYGLQPIASPFDEERLSWVINQPDCVIKIGFGVYRDRRYLVDAALSSGRKVIISLDPAATQADVDPYPQYNNKYYLLTSRKYPTLLEDCRLPDDFNETIFQGYSDHCPGISAALIAISRGARTIEKHFTLSHAWQKTGEMAHTGSADLNQLIQLRAMEREIRIISSKDHTYF